MRCFPDDIEMPCQDCHVTIYHRPHAIPAAAKLCVSCSRIRRGLESHKGMIATTRQVLEDVERFFK